MARLSKKACVDWELRGVLIARKPQGQKTLRTETDTNATNAFRQLLCKAGGAGG